MHQLNRHRPDNINTTLHLTPLIQQLTVILRTSWNKLPASLDCFGVPAHHTFVASVLHSPKLAVESVFVRCIAVTYMCKPQGQNLANVVFALLHRGSRTPCQFISVLLPSAENSSGLGSKPTSLSAPTQDSPLRIIEECNYLLT